MMTVPRMANSFAQRLSGSQWTSPPGTQTAGCRRPLVDVASPLDAFAWTLRHEAARARQQRVGTLHAFSCRAVGAGEKTHELQGGSALWADGCDTPQPRAEAAHAR